MRGLMLVAAGVGLLLAGSLVAYTVLARGEPAPLLAEITDFEIGVG